MAVKDLIPWNNGGREVGFQRGADIHPFFALHREMNRMFDDVFRGFDLAPFGPSSRTQNGLGWPQIDIDETNKEVRITAELPGLEEKDVSLDAALRGQSDPAEKKPVSEAKLRGGKKGGGGGQGPPLQRAVRGALADHGIVTGMRTPPGHGRVQERRADRH